MFTKWLSCVCGIVSIYFHFFLRWLVQPLFIVVSDAQRLWQVCFLTVFSAQHNWPLLGPPGMRCCSIQLLLIINWFVFSKVCCITNYLCIWWHVVVSAVLSSELFTGVQAQLSIKACLCPSQRINDTASLLRVKSAGGLEMSRLGCSWLWVHLHQDLLHPTYTDVSKSGAEVSLAPSLETAENGWNLSSSSGEDSLSVSSRTGSRGDSSPTEESFKAHGLV